MAAAALSLSQHSSNPLELDGNPSSDAHRRNLFADLSAHTSDSEDTKGMDENSATGPLPVHKYHSHLSRILMGMRGSVASKTKVGKAAGEMLVDLDSDEDDGEGHEVVMVPGPSRPRERIHRRRSTLRQSHKPEEMIDDEDENDGTEDQQDVEAEDGDEEGRDSDHDVELDEYTSSSGSEIDEASTLQLKPRSEQMEILAEISDLQHAIPSLAQDYKLLDRLGTGTFSSVYKALDIHHAKWYNVEWQGHHPPTSSAHYQSKPHAPDEPVYVAVKRIHVTSSPERIRNEISVMEDCRSCRHVSQLITAFRSGDQVVAIMPYHRNEDFRDYYRLMPVLGIKYYLRCMFRALRDIHARQIIHRDVKPANFLFDPRTGIGTLCDFGLASRMSSTSSATYGSCMHTPPTRAHPHGNIKTNLGLSVDDVKRMQKEARAKCEMVAEKVGYPEKDTRPVSKANRAGTRGFRAPEVLLKCGDQTGAIDVWSTGVIFLFFLTGKFPIFQSNDDIEALMEIASIIGKKRMEKVATLHSRTFATNVPSVTMHGMSWRELVEKLNPELMDPRPAKEKAFPFNDPVFYARKERMRQKLREELWKEIQTGHAQSRSRDTPGVEEWEHVLLSDVDVDRDGDELQSPRGAKRPRISDAAASSETELSPGRFNFFADSSSPSSLPRFDDEKDFLTSSPLSISRLQWSSPGENVAAGKKRARDEDDGIPGVISRDADCDGNGEVEEGDGQHPDDASEEEQEHELNERLMKREEELERRWHAEQIEQALDLLEGIMHPESTKRLTPAQALEHPFLKYLGDPLIPESLRIRSVRKGIEKDKGKEKVKAGGYPSKNRIRPREDGDGDEARARRDSKEDPDVNANSDLDADPPIEDDYLAALDCADDEDFVPHQPTQGEGACAALHFRDAVTDQEFVKLAAPECACGCGQAGFEDVRALVKGEGVPIGRRRCEFHREVVEES